MRKINLVALLVSVILVSSCSENDHTPRSTTVLYFADWDGMQVGVAGVDRPNKFSVIANAKKDNLSETGAIAVDTKNQFIYITEEGNARILRKNLNGTGTMAELYNADDGVESPVAIELDTINKRIYWIDQSLGKVMWGSLDGTTNPASVKFESDLSEPSLYGFQIDVKNNKIYIADALHGILAGDLDGTSTLEALYPVGEANVTRPTSLTLDAEAGKLYWTDESTKSILVAPSDGSASPVALITVDPANTPIAVAIDKVANRIYWAEAQSDLIAYRNLDGTGSTSVLLQGVRSFCIRVNNTGK